MPHSPLRAALGGLSLLLLVAMAVQTSAVVVEGASLSRGPGIRMIAEAMTRQMERQVRRQEERPVAASAYPVIAAGLDGGEVVGCGIEVARTRLLGTWLTDLPPPAIA